MTVREAWFSIGFAAATALWWFIWRAWPRLPARLPPPDQERG